MKSKVYDVMTWAALLLIGMALVAPALLAFSQGKNGEPTVWNFVGLAYMGGWVYVLNKKARSHGN